MSVKPWGKTKTGEAVERYTLRNSRGIQVDFITYGGIITSILAPDRKGVAGDIVLGFDSLEGYLGDHPYFGAIVGRYANRIARGRFVLDGKEYRLARNNGDNALHGGLRGFDKVVWKARQVKDGVELSYLSKDGEEGYPGNLQVKVTYLLNDKNELRIEYEAVTDKPTVVNLTNHSYFNLSAGASADILDHRLRVNADRFTPVDAGLIPTGELRSVAGTPFDFRAPHAIGERIHQPDEQLRLGRGYDHNFVLNRRGSGLEMAARVVEAKSGRVLEVLTTEPGMQLYTGNFLDGSLRGKGGRLYGRHAGLCLETQHFPDSPNRPEFPSTVLRPGQTFRSTTVYRLSVN